MKILLTALLCSLAPACVFSSAGTSPSEHTATWSDFASQFQAAFDRGDVDRLEALKSEWSHKGFGNINDLGGYFMKYGAGMEKWDALIADAKKNKK